MSTETTAAPGNETAATTEAQTATDTTATASAPAQTETKAVDTGTLLSVAADATDKVATAPADWPTDWRSKLAGEDAKALKQLERYGSPADVYKKTRELESKLSSGEYKRDLPKDAKPEEVAAWRTERGLPEKAEDYLEKLTLPEGVVLGEADKPIAAAFAEAAFEGNVDPGQYSKLVNQYYKLQDQLATQRAEADRDNKIKAEDALRAEFGPEYRPNLQAVSNLLAGLPDGAADNFLGGRTAEGIRIGDHPGIIKWLANISRELNPAATLLPESGGVGGKGIEDRIAAIEKIMATDRPAYFRDEKVQAEYRTLVEARDKNKSRAA